MGSSLSSVRSSTDDKSELVQWFITNGLTHKEADETYEQFAEHSVTSIGRLQNSYTYDNNGFEKVVQSLNTGIAGTIKKALQLQNLPFDFVNNTTFNTTRLGKRRPMIIGKFSKKKQFNTAEKKIINLHESVRVIYFSKPESKRDDTDVLQLPQENNDECKEKHPKNNNDYEKSKPKLFVRVFVIELRYNEETKRNILRISGPLVNDYKIHHYKCDQYYCLNEISIDDIVIMAQNIMNKFGNYNFIGNNCKTFTKELMTRVTKRAASEQLNSNVKIDCQTVENYISEYYCESYRYSFDGGGDDNNINKNDDELEMNHLFQEEIESKHEENHSDRGIHSWIANDAAKHASSSKRIGIKSKPISFMDVVGDETFKLPNPYNIVYEGELERERKHLRGTFFRAYGVLKKDRFLYLYKDKTMSTLEEKLPLQKAELVDNDDENRKFRIGRFFFFKACEKEESLRHECENKKERKSSRDEWKEKINMLVGQKVKIQTLYQTQSAWL